MTGVALVIVPSAVKIGGSSSVRLLVSYGSSHCMTTIWVPLTLVSCATSC